MSASYGQFCPIAKASEIFATRRTLLIVREVMTGVHSFNDIHRGVPLISWAVLVARLRELEGHGVIERRPRADSAGYEYWLTPAGEGLCVSARGRPVGNDLHPRPDQTFRSRSRPHDRAIAQACRSEHAAGSPRRPALRIFRRAGRPHEISNHVADPSDDPASTSA
jgi:DNA-binding HxlR family transcriptional regulator